MEGKQTIIQIAKDIYGETVQVYLFGSRLNDEKRGGDIDLLVRSTGEKKGVLARIRMTARLKLHLGDQKIDVIGDHEDSPGSTGSLEKRNTTDMTEKKIHRIILCLKRMLPSF